MRICSKWHEGGSFFHRLWQKKKKKNSLRTEQQRLSVKREWPLGTVLEIRGKQRKMAGFFFFSHGFELVDALFGVALSDLSQRLVLVAAGFDVLLVQHVVLGLLGFVSGFGQL